MQTITKAQAADILATYGHVYLGAGSTPLAELSERIDQHSRDNAERLAAFAELRHATRAKGYRVWFTSLKSEGGADSVIDLSGKDTTVYVQGQYLIVYTHHKADARCSFDSINSVAYFIPAMSEALAA